MQFTDYHAKYFAHELTRRYPSDSVEKFAGAVASAQVDLNPHQVDAALFAFRSPLSKGTVLADEVGLGKTIEAGLVISQRWAERKRLILIITPANLRKQWHQELTEKFFLPCVLIESRSYNAAIKLGNFRPFEAQDSVVICSYHFARSKASDVSATPWDLVVASIFDDEEHSDAEPREIIVGWSILNRVVLVCFTEREKYLVRIITARPATKREREDYEKNTNR